MLSSPVCSSPKRRRAQCSTDLLLLEYLRIISSEDGNVEVECDFDLVIKDGGDTSRKVFFVAKSFVYACVCVCVCVRARASERIYIYACMCMTISENI